MTTRTFKLLGQAYGASPATITVKIDNVVIFQDTTPTLNIAGIPLEPSDNELCSWQKDVTFAGNQNLEIRVSGGSLVVEQIIANQILIPYVGGSAPALIPGGDRSFGVFYAENTDAGLLVDPIKNAAINGVSVNRPVTADTLGTWRYVLYDGDVFTATVATRSGFAQTVWSSGRSYGEQDLVFHNDVVYFAKQAVPANQDITNTSYWAQLPAAAWSADRSYGVMTTVSHNGRLYTSKFAVPQNTDIANVNYWNDYDGDRAEIYALGILD